MTSTSLDPGQIRQSVPGKRIAVLGAAGLLGRALVKHLTALGHDVIAIDITGESPIIQADILDLDALEQILQANSPDVVCNLAYLLGDVSETHIRRALEVNVLGFANALEASARVSATHRFVYGSSIAVYGKQETDETGLLNEESHGTPTILYGWMKQLNEAVADAYARSGALETIGLRISTVFGLNRTGGQSAVFSNLLRAVAEARPFVSLVPPQHEVALIHVDDVAASLAELITSQSPKWSIYNSGGELITMQAFVDLVRQSASGAEVTFDSYSRDELSHASRISSRRLYEEFDIRRMSLRDRITAELKLAQTASKAVTSDGPLVSTETKDGLEPQISDQRKKELAREQ